jgi:hypothetical protein
MGLWPYDERLRLAIGNLIDDGLIKKLPDKKRV